MTTSGLNFATLWEAIAAEVPDADALVHGDSVRSWADFETNAARFAAGLAAHGIGHHGTDRQDGSDADKVALFLFNEPTYLEAQFGIFKQRAIPCNVNYRYLADELWYLLDNADAAAVVADHTIVDRVLAVSDRLPDLRLIVQVGGEVDAEAQAAAGDTVITTYADFLAAHEPALPIERSPQDLWFLYTGGTTGHPKAVMWPHDNIVNTMTGVFAALKRPIPTSVDEALDAVRFVHENNVTTRMLAGAPLMHGTSGLSSLHTLSVGGAVGTLESRSFDADELFVATNKHKLSHLTIVGDAFCKPMLASLQAAAAAGTPHDVTTLFQIVSSGVIWSAESKAALLEFGDLALVDSLGSSEGVGFGVNITRRDSGQEERKTARFTLGPNSRVLTDEGEEVVPGSGVVGKLALRGSIPVGYYKAPEKSDETFPKINGQRWSIPGDYATIEQDGSITLLGRGSVSINSAGEKIYPEEVEEALKLHPAVMDANAVGVPDEKWGQAVCGVVEIDPASEATDEEIIAHVKTVIASYKAPKTLVRVDEFLRSPNGKSDYKWANAQAKG